MKGKLIGLKKTQRSDKEGKKNWEINEIKRKRRKNERK